jgi:hypothetical protein
MTRFPNTTPGQSGGHDFDDVALDRADADRFGDQITDRIHFRVAALRTLGSPRRVANYTIPDQRL